MHQPRDKVAHTTAFVIPVVKHWLEREIAQWVHNERSIQQPIQPLAEDMFVLFLFVVVCLLLFVVVVFCF